MERQVLCPPYDPYTAENTAARGGVLWQDLKDGALEGVKAVRKVEESARREESGSREREGGSGSFTLYPTALYSFKVVDSGFLSPAKCASCGPTASSTTRAAPAWSTLR